MGAMLPLHRKTHTLEVITRSIGGVRAEIEEEGIPVNLTITFLRLTFSSSVFATLLVDRCITST